MENQTRIFVSTNLWNLTSYPQSVGVDVPQGGKTLLQQRILDESKSGKITWHLTEPIPDNRGTERVKDTIDSPSERRKGTPQEEFIEVDPNFSEERSEEEKEELLKTARKENKKGT